MSYSISDYGTLLKAETWVGSGTFSVVAEINTIKPPELMNPKVEVTHHQSPSGFREFIASGLKEIGEVVVGLNYLSTGTASAIWAAPQFYADLIAGTVRAYQIDFPVAASTPTGTYAPPTWQFSALVTNIKPGDIDSASPENVSVEVTFAPTASLLLV